MAAEPTSTSAPIAGDPRIAGFWRRLGALVIDIIILAAPALVLGLALFRWFAALGQAGRLIGFAVALLYFGAMNSRIGGGQTLGKRLLGIRVVDGNGNELSAPRSATRFLVLGSPYFLNGLWFAGASPPGLRDYALGWLLIFIVFGGGGAIVYLFVFNRRTRQSLHDLVLGSFVVRAQPATAPIADVTPRLHLIVAGCWLVLALILPGVAIWLMHQNEPALSAQLQPLVELQAAVDTVPGIEAAKVTVGKTVVTGPDGATSTNYLQVEAGSQRDDLDALARLIARLVLDRQPDLLGRQQLAIQLRRGFDLGIASWGQGYREAHTVADWGAKLR